MINNRFIVGQLKIAENKYMQEYQTIIQIRTIFITHRSNNDCRTEICTKHTPCCGGN